MMHIFGFPICIAPYLILAYIASVYGSIAFFISPEFDVCSHGGASIACKDNTNRGGLCAVAQDTNSLWCCPAPDTTCWVLASQCGGGSSSAPGPGQISCSNADTNWCCDEGYNTCVEGGLINLCISTFTSNNAGVPIASANLTEEAFLASLSAPTPIATAAIQAPRSSAAAQPAIEVASSSYSSAKASLNPSPSPIPSPIADLRGNDNSDSAESTPIGISRGSSSNIANSSPSGSSRGSVSGIAESSPSGSVRGSSSDSAERSPSGSPSSTITSAIAATPSAVQQSTSVSKSSSTLGVGPIVGIVVGIVIGILLICALVLVCIRRHRRQRQGPVQHRDSPQDSSLNQALPKRPMEEMDGSNHASELQARAMYHELRA